jgi:CRP-like cAMP-binding protein/acyl dehydratase
MQSPQPAVPIPDVLPQLAAVPLLRTLTDESRATVARSASVVEVPVGGRIFEEGEPTTQLYVVLSGEASLVVSLGGGVEPMEIAAVGPGETLGELNVLLGEPRATSAYATQPCRLLRLDATSFRRFAESMPGFGAGISRELARQLRAALDDSKKQRAVHPAVARRVARPPIERWGAYLGRYYAEALRGVLRPHRLTVADPPPLFEDDFSYTAAERDRWYALFGVRDASAAMPFTYFTTSGTLALMRIVRELGVNFRHLLHLRSEIQLNPEGRVLAPGERYRCTYRLRDIVRLRADRAALVVKTDVHDGAGRLMLSEQDYFIIKNLPARSVDALDGATPFARRSASAQLPPMGKRVPRLAPNHAEGDASVSRTTLSFGPGMGVAYGRVSGDMNLVHTTALAARLFGYRRPFVQGLCTANHVLRALTEAAAGSPPARLTIDFCRPVPVGSEMALYTADGQFELLDAQHNVAACGSWEATSTVRARRSYPLVFALSGGASAPES